MKRFTMFFTVIVTVALLLAGCGDKKAQTTPTNTGDGSGLATTEASSSDNAGWFGYFSALTRRDSSQYNTPLCKSRA
jgi:serine protease inhibitor